jgi:hypothetical protein
MKSQFSLIETKSGHVLVFGDKNGAVAYTDYDGRLDRENPTDGEWYPLGNDRDSVFAWHGERMKGPDGVRDLGKVTYTPPKNQR